MAEDLVQRVRTAIARYDLLRPDAGPVVVGVSGGADSLTLAHVLAALGYDLLVAHLDHGLRAASAAQAEAVRAWAQEQGWPVVVQRASVAQRARQERLSLEDAARRERYAFLFEVAATHQAQAVAVGHTLDDQAETVLLRLLRGAGVEGLRAMQPRTCPTPWHPSIPLVRPLLEVPRAATQAYAQRHALPVQTDESNRDPRFLRNRVRHEVLPLLAQLNPRIREVLARTAAALAADAELLAAMEDEAWERTVAQSTRTWVRVHGPAWRALPRGLRYRVLRRAGQQIHPNPLWRPSWPAIVRGEALWRKGRAEIPQPWIGGLYLLSRPDGLFVMRGPQEPPGPWPQLPAGEQALAWGPGRSLPLAHGWRAVASAILPAEQARMALAERPAGPWEAWLDPEAAPPPWHMGPPRPGERFAPLGLDGHTLTVGNAFTNRKIPRGQRARWPLLRDAHGRLAWFPGYGPAHWARLTKASRQAVHLRLIPPTDTEPAL